MSFLKPLWPAPNFVHALTTFRSGGDSLPPFDSQNYGLHVGDNEKHVLANRASLKSKLNLKHEPFWLNQTHSVNVVWPEKTDCRDADAAITQHIDKPLVIMTADCMPILICNQKEREIAAIHAGWKGLQQGIIENTLNQMESSVAHRIAWIGPSICQHCFEVGDEVREIFLKENPHFQHAFKPKGKKWLLNLSFIAEMILKELGVSSVFHSKTCTFEQDKEFYSYRKTNITGRMASLIWMSNT